MIALRIGIEAFDYQPIKAKNGAEFTHDIACLVSTNWIMIFQNIKLNVNPTFLLSVLKNIFLCFEHRNKK